MRVAIDVGGTFTDVLFYNEESRSLWSAKVSSNPENPAVPFMQGFERVLRQAQVKRNQVEYIVHGTTVVTNALFERKIAKTGLLVTSGFGDLLEIGRQQRPNLYDLFTARLPPLVPRSLIREVTERVDSDGKVLIPLNELEAKIQISSLRELEIESLAIVLLFSFKNAAHEKRLEGLARQILPGVLVFPSHQILAEFREYERASSTVIAASVAPRVVSYIRSINSHLQNREKISSRLMIMHSGGGTLPAAEAARRPHTLVESGPAAGLIACSHLSQNLGLQQAIAFDMGGTTAKTGLILDGLPQLSSEYEVGGEVHASGRTSGSGYPLRSPMIDIIECGAGAGSIAWVDSGNHLKVGPQSAGASPGPACYNLGGTEPTVTDAHLLLGHLAPDSFLGGEIQLHESLAEKVICKRISNQLGMNLKQAAAGILAIVNANMLRILRVVSVARGHDPRDFTLVAYGGAGPMHATDLANNLGISQVIIPRFPGLFSALGLLYAELSNNFLETVMIPLDEESLTGINTALSKLVSSAESWLDSNQIGLQDRILRVSADLRYSRQNYELNLPFPETQINFQDVGSIINLFHQEHKAVYGHCAPGEIVQIVNLYVQAARKVSLPQLPSIETTEKCVKNAKINSRKVWFTDDLIDCDIYDRTRLQAGHTLIGPAIIQERESTTLINPGWRLHVDRLGNLVIKQN